MHKYILWDVDTQYDFMMPEGLLYVPRAEKLIGNIQKIVDTARALRVPVLGSVDYHSPEDGELSDNPDFKNTFPPHCLQNSTGQEKVIKPVQTLWIDSTAYNTAELKNRIKTHVGDIIFRKQKFDVFSNPNVIPVLESLAPENIIVFGVALDVCVAHAIKGLLRMKHRRIFLVSDAVAAINPEEGQRLMREWNKSGVVIQTTEETLDFLQHG